MKIRVGLTIIILAAFSLVFAKHANSSWFNQGKELLKVFSGGKTQNTKKTTAYAGLTTSEISAGLKDALKVGTENVVKQLGVRDGFYKDNKVHIPLPENLQKIKNTLNKIGMASTLNNLELKLNRAAETATPKAKKLFWNAIADMKISDVKKIYNGPNDAATQYFKEKMGEPLKKEMKPIINKSLSQVEAVQVYNSILDRYNSLPFVKPAEGDISTYVLNKAINGIFYYLSKEEAAIREDPAKRTTQILKKVFDNQSN